LRMGFNLPAGSQAPFVDPCWGTSIRPVVAPGSDQAAAGHGRNQKCEYRSHDYQPLNGRGTRSLIAARAPCRPRDISSQGAHRHHSEGSTSVGLKEKIESNPVAWMLGTLVVGFAAGIGADEFVIRVAQLEVTSKADIEASKKEVDDLKSKQAAQTKQIRFLSYYLRYALANLQPFKGREEYQDVAGFRSKLDDYMLKFIDESEKTE